MDLKIQYKHSYNLQEYDIDGKKININLAVFSKTPKISKLFIDSVIRIIMLK